MSWVRSFVEISPALGLQTMAREYLGHKSYVGSADAGDGVAENSLRVFVELGVRFRAVGPHRSASFPCCWSGVTSQTRVISEALLPQGMGVSRQLYLCQAEGKRDCYPSSYI